jgi:hypothetical protein
VRAPPWLTFLYVSVVWWGVVSLWCANSVMDPDDWETFYGAMILSFVSDEGPQTAFCKVGACSPYSPLSECHHCKYHRA